MHRTEDTVDASIVATKFKTKSGNPATIFRSTEFCNNPFIVLVALLFHGTALAFVQGSVAVLLFCYTFPSWFTFPTLLLYVGHVALSSAHNTGSMAWSWYRKSAMAFAGLQYFNFAMSIENDVQLQSGKSYLFGVHPHGIFTYGQVMWMSTRASNPFYYRFPFLVDRCSLSHNAFYLH